MNSSADRPGRQLVSVVVPVFNEEDNVGPLHQRLRKVEASLEGAAMEIIFVDDGSRDGTYERLRALRRDDDQVRIVKLSRNFGHQAAVTAGVDSAAGDAVVLIDADLQDPPELIVEMVRKWREGYDVVFAVRARREGESPFKLWTASLFYRLIRRITQVEIPLDTGDFRLMSRRLVDDLRRLGERHRFIRGLVAWLGYRQIGVEYVREQRLSGETKYPLRRMLKFAVDGITSFSFVPLQLATWLGFLAASSAFVGVGVVLYYRLFTDIPLPGWASVMISLLFLGGVQLMTLGLIGEYIGRIYDEVKARPLYIVEEKHGFVNTRASG